MCLFFSLDFITINIIITKQQNKYYNPLRFSVTALTKFVMEPNNHPTDKYLFDQGIGATGELIYTIDKEQNMKYQLKLDL